MPELATNHTFVLDAFLTCTVIPLTHLALYAPVGIIRDYQTKGVGLCKYRSPNYQKHLY